MARQTVSFEWQVAENEQWWDNLPALPKAPVTQRRGMEAERRLVRHLLRALALCGVTVLLVTSMALPPEVQAQYQMQTTVRRLLTLEEDAWQANDAAFYDRLVDAKTSGQWRSEWRTFWSIPPGERDELGTKLMSVAPQGELVQAQVLVTHPAIEWWRSSPYREVRFYRETETGWVRTMPPADFWGKLRTFETDHLHFQFHEHDRPLVNQIADRMEAGYVRLYDLLDIELPSAHTKLKFEIVPETASGWMTAGSNYEISSPSVSRVPDGLTNAEFLAHNIMSRLVYRLTSSGQGSSWAVGTQWRALQWAMSGWLRTEVLGQRAPWHRQAEGIFQAHLQYHWPLHLADLAAWDESQTDEQAQLMVQYIAAESVIAYIVMTAGEQRVPELLRGMNKYDGWDRYIAGVLQQDVATFEVGWNRYLRERYGMTLEDLVHHDRALSGGN